MFGSESHAAGDIAEDVCAFFGSLLIRVRPTQTEALIKRIVEHDLRFALELLYEGGSLRESVLLLCWLLPRLLVPFGPLVPLS